MIASAIWLPTECTGLNEDIGSWKISAISAPRIARMAGPFGGSAARSITSPAPSPSPSPPARRRSRRKRISPATIRPGRSTMPRMERAVTLLPQPLSPTAPSVAPGARSKLTPSTAFTVPSSWWKYVLSPRTDKRGSARSAAIGIRGVPEAVAQEIERHDRHDHRQGGEHEPGRDRHRLDVLGLLQQHAPADRGRTQAEAEEGQRGLAHDHGRQGERGRRDDVAHEGGHHVDEDGPRAATAHQPGGDHEVLLAQGEEAPAHDPGELRPAQQRDD